MPIYEMTMKEVLPDGVTTEPRTLIFQVHNHDDLFSIVTAVQTKNIVQEEEQYALAIGLKLLSEVVLHNRRKQPFLDLLPALSGFIQNVKRYPEGS